MQGQIEAVQRMQDYIDAHLSESISLASLSKAAEYSQWHARRLFEKWTGLTPAHYIRRLRLSRSALRLRDEECRVLDVALDMGFDSAEGYQRAFCREFGINPAQYARQPVPLALFTPFGVQYRYPKEEGTMSEKRNLSVRAVERPARRVILKRGREATEYFAYCREVGCDIWGILRSIPSLFGEPVCLWLPDAYRAPGTSLYVQGVEVAPDYTGPVPEGFETIDLPAAQYLEFHGEPFDQADFAQAIGEIWEAEKRYDPAQMGFAWDDQNPRIQLEPIGERGYIELVPVKPAAGT